MTPLSMLENIRLLETMAVHSDDQEFLGQVRQEILRRITQKSAPDDCDSQLIESMIECLQTMEATDSDLAHQSETLLELGRQYAGLRAKLLARLRGESLALQEECV